MFNCQRGVESEDGRGKYARGSYFAWIVLCGNGQGKAENNEELECFVLGVCAVEEVRELLSLGKEIH